MPKEYMTPEAFVGTGEYLPEPLRDFHDAKDFFKVMHSRVNVEKHDYCKEIGWVSGHCYVIDIFLWWMAKHGWTLQRSRKQVDFLDLDETIGTWKKRQMEEFREMMRGELGKG